MDFDYFYKEQSNQYAFYRVPKALIIEEYFEKLSIGAKLLYGLCLDRVSLSANSGWIDEQGRVYIVYTIKSIMRDMHCGTKKAVKLLSELESYDLVEKVIRGQGKPTLIYVKNFSTLLSKGKSQDCQKENSRVVEREILELSKGQSNNTNINNTEMNNTNLILSEDTDLDEREDTYRYFYSLLDMEILKNRYPYDSEVLEGLLDMIVDVMCSNRKTIYIAGDRKPIGVVKSQFMKLNSMHIEYVMEGLSKNNSKVYNIKQFMLAALYNAPLTMKSYYRACVNNDRATGKLSGGTNESN